MLFLSFVLGYIAGVGGGSCGYLEWVIYFSTLPIFTYFLLGKQYTLFSVFAITGILLGGYIGDKAYETEMENWRSFSYILGTSKDTFAIHGKLEQKAYSQDLESVYRLDIDNIVNTSTKVRQYPPGKISVTIPNNLHVFPGETLSFTGKIYPTISLPLSGFERYNFSRSVYGHSYAPVFKREPLEKVSPFLRIQEWSTQTILHGFPRDTAAVLLGMILGNTELLSTNIKDAFLLSGISHILVVSGSNIAFVILLIMGIFRYLPVGQSGRIFTVVLFVGIYSTLVGWDTSVTRATVMGLLAFLSIQGGKRASSIALLFLVAFILLLFRPLLLVYDAGFGLSFGATLGILLFYETLSKTILRIRIPKVFATIFGVTIAASIGSMPALIYHFGTISTGSVLANLLIALVLGWVMMTGVIYLIMAIFGGYILYIFGWLIYIPVKYIILVSEFFSLGGTVEIPEEWRLPICILFLGYFLVEILASEGLRINQFQKDSSNQ